MEEVNAEGDTEAMVGMKHNLAKKEYLINPVDDVHVVATTLHHKKHKSKKVPTDLKCLDSHREGKENILLIDFEYLLSSWQTSEKCRQNGDEINCNLQPLQLSLKLSKQLLSNEIWKIIMCKLF